jgi:rfaE bifunctional protein kinase chain/domain
MDAQRFKAIAEKYPTLRVAVLGDFCLDRYFEIDPAKEEISIETGLPVHNVINVRAQPGGAGTVLNNLSALGIGEIYPIGFAGDDGEGFELGRALENLPGVRLNFFVRTAGRRTFTYYKPLVVAPNCPPRELNRLDIKNWTPTPAPVQDLLTNHLLAAAKLVNTVVVMNQTDVPETGVVTKTLLRTLQDFAAMEPRRLILADSRRGLSDFPPVVFKMNAAELSALMGTQGELSLDQIRESAIGLARRNHQPVFVTLAERGIIHAAPDGTSDHVHALPVRGQIDVVGAGDAVTANLTAALAAGATLREALEIATVAASVVIHKLGTTGTASPGEIENVIKNNFLS